MRLSWQGQKDSNPRHAVLETAALPAELYPYSRYLYRIPKKHKIVKWFEEKRRKNFFEKILKKMLTNCTTYIIIRFVDQC